VITINANTLTKHPRTTHKHHCHSPTPTVAPTNHQYHPTQISILDITSMKKLKPLCIKINKDGTCSLMTELGWAGQKIFGSPGKHFHGHGAVSTCPSSHIFSHLAMTRS